MNIKPSIFAFNIRRIRIFISLILLSSLFPCLAQKSLSYYLPDIAYDSNITTPEEFLKFQIGEWHITHDQLISYLTSICHESDNCIMTEYARSHENRPLVYFTISSIENLKNLDSLKLIHKQLTNPEISPSIDISHMPLVLYQGYSIHGDESSGSNASALVAYYLLAGKSKKLESLLEKSILLLDPCYNPDGLNRFASWVNSHKAATPNPDPQTRELNEPWPTGRTNHYWFDLNRDWLFNIHPSSEGRIKVFHEWKPDILTDHHEMGSNSTFFFQPGVPSRTNPLTPSINQKLTEDISHFHAHFLDSIGSEYFTKLRYDDYYYGKGSTYPDIQGSIGILFEQASSLGHLRQTKTKVLDFPFTIRNQVVTSLSTQEAALNLREEILEYKRSFFTDQLQSENCTGYYVFSEADPFKSQFFIDLLQRHDINVYGLSVDKEVEGKKFGSESSFVVPKNQNQCALVQTIFEEVSEFPDSIFYDVSTWTLPHALQMTFAQSKKNIKENELKAITTFQTDTVLVNNNSAALKLDWSAYNSPLLLNLLLTNDIEVMVLSAQKNDRIDNAASNIAKGTLFVPLNQKGKSNLDIQRFVNKAVIAHKLKVQVLSKSQWDLITKNHSLSKATSKNIAMIIGEGINPYDAGYSWYQLDKRLQMPVSLIDYQNLNNFSLDAYHVIILPDGSYRFSAEHNKKLRSWIENGGTLIAFRKAIDYAILQKWLPNLHALSPEIESLLAKLNIKDTSHSGHHSIGGSIMNCTIDNNHPLFWGYNTTHLASMKQGTQYYYSDNDNAVPMRYAQDPVLSGYVSNVNRIKASEAATIMCSSMGSGKIIACVDNPNFRGIWMAGSKLFANMIFMSEYIAESSMISELNR